MTTLSDKFKDDFDRIKFPRRSKIMADVLKENPTLEYLQQIQLTSDLYNEAVEKYEAEINAVEVEFTLKLLEHYGPYDIEHADSLAYILYDEAKSSVIIDPNLYQYPTHDIEEKYQKLAELMTVIKLADFFK